MEKEIKELLSNPKLLYSAAAFLSIFLAVACVDLYSMITYEDPFDFEINLSSTYGMKLNYSFVVEMPLSENISLLQSSSKK